MKKSLEELMEVSIKVRELLQCGSFELHHYYSGSYVDFTPIKVTDVQALLNAACGLKMMIFSNDASLVVRLFEREDESDT